MKKSKLAKIIICLLIILAIIAGVIYYLNNSKSELVSIKSEKELKNIYEGKIDGTKNILINVLTMPFSFFANNTYKIYNYQDSIVDASGINGSLGIVDGLISANESTTSSSKDYSTTNIQVENVDEADIIKTDGDYIYSISGTKVVITNVVNPNEIKISSTIELNDGGIPEDLLIYDNKLIIISEEVKTGGILYIYNKNNTIINIYDTTNKEQPVQVKKIKLYEDYYTSRCIDNKLYIISNGKLREEDDDIITTYEENWNQKEIGLDNIKRFKEIETNTQTIIAMVDLNNIENDANVNSYLIDVSNAYVSENSIYLLNQKYEGSYGVPPIKSLFGLAGAIGPFIYEDEEDSGYYTQIYKFDFKDNGTIEYSCKNKVKGKTINQYSVDEYNNTLRLAVYDNDGSRVVVFDEKLNEIGKTSNLAKGETMYSSRFIGNKAYLVTYKTIDPLFVIDLSNPSNPEVLGELKIPGYSTYLHPYDENHIIGIGMETKEQVYRDINGRVISTTSKIVGMKMALFDVSNVNNPIQLSSTVIGDSRTTSAILTNPKALLFSKEKELIAIPVNNLAQDFEITDNFTTYSSLISSYTARQKNYVSEGYIVFNINLEDGFNKKGVITHENENYPAYYYSTKSFSKLLRGVYIDNNLYTVSEDKIKVNDLDTLKLLSELNIKGDE